MNSPWNALLEALHSAFIDELNERFVSGKPCLGLPMKQNGFLPPENVRKIIILRTEIQGVHEQGIVFLSTSDASINLDQVWGGVLTRLSFEFSRRGIIPELTPIENASALAIQRSIWIPIEIHGQWYLGIGI